MTIWKYVLEVNGTNEFDIPLNGKILSLQVQGSMAYPIPHIYIWVLVDENEKVTEKRQFKIFGTGHIIQDVSSLIYIGTVQMYDGKLVFHLFEVIK
jgi:hypothetical protein